MKGAPRKTRYVKATQLKEDNMAVYTLPELPYDYSALEPYISGEIMELHHDKHHKAYVDGANTALDKLAEARDKADFGAINKLEKDLAFNLAGHVNHSVFWKNMAPKGSAPERPTDELGAAIDEFFGSFDNMKAQFTAAATGIQGSGWASLVWDPLGKRINTLQFYDHQNNLPAGSIPLLQLDMWEHAFYLQYKNVKGDYVKSWWNVVNWDDVALRFSEARVA
ncbi:Iron/Manganese superoxide dismutase (Superoxide dismutase [Mn/Fe]) (SODM) [Propionibacterium freudenreichii]|nr:Iron/Manganese superoxide dismutase (Superoxide dismutase [Mn/Fe]) (SODM) [Propionibacterium freudenreichii]CEI26367.1 Iron/Manganese superoxide dismutase (Superoxide dismutase [Mn/Fe]) (SODM) [Propionibacterium freudenreichii]CEI32982.1 Iron/Manganese superoxide dismutase (Superoxide dismutase [Mn/Fe]) (SODM) [Propionibacterium freudenreichii]CEI46882.1 Iron/Manganese superoxide dismutase (Superoxide dismutase [Mn/Fe]) (SODM) [Propionibacterium freudenreichii]SBN60568.1 Superoxide dismutase